MYILQTRLLKYWLGIGLDDPSKLKIKINPVCFVLAARSASLPSEPEPDPQVTTISLSLSLSVGLYMSLFPPTHRSLALATLRSQFSCSTSLSLTHTHTFFLSLSLSLRQFIYIHIYIYTTLYYIVISLITLVSLWCFDIYIYSCFATLFYQWPRPTLNAISMPSTGPFTERLTDPPGLTRGRGIFRDRW